MEAVIKMLSVSIPKGLLNVFVILDLGEMDTAVVISMNVRTTRRYAIMDNV